MKAQLRELLGNYGPIGVLWFDGQWESTWTHERGLNLYDFVRGLQPKIIVNNKWAFPLIALVFAALNTGLYWALRPILNLATLGAAGFVIPLVANLLLLLGTIRIFQSKKWLEVQGMRATLWLAALLTLVHGALYLGLDYLPKQF